MVNQWANWITQCNYKKPGSLFSTQFDRVSLASRGSQQTVGAIETSFLYWLLLFLQSPDWCCLQHQQCRFVYPPSKWKTCWILVWADTVLLASQQKCMTISFFSVSCVLKRTPKPLINRHTQSLSLTHSLTQGRDKRRTGKTSTFILFFFCFVSFSSLTGWGQVIRNTSITLSTHSAFCTVFKEQNV